MPIATDPFLATLALVGAVIVIAALLSGLIERSGVPQVAVLLGLGAVLGPFGLGLVNAQLDSPILRAVATISLALVLFTDALSVNVKEMRRHGSLTAIVLGPGTLLPALILLLAAHWLLDLPWPLAAILGAALASTDPVLLRGLLRRPDLPPEARLALRLESGLNDVVLLPIVLVAMAFLGTHADQGWGRMMLELFALGPFAGVAIGLVGVATLDLVRRRLGIRRDYESLYSLGLAFAAFAAAESLHGSGFLAAFAAGVTISLVDVELCDCFQEYGETTAEMALLFTFVLLGGSLIWSGVKLLSGPTLLFALLAVLVRPLVLLLALAPARIERRSHLLIAWFGPRGLSSLLLVLLPVFAGLPGAGDLFSLCTLVVLLSVVVHGGSMTLLGRSAAPATPAGIPSGEALPVLAGEEQEKLPERMSLEEVDALRARGEEVVMLDARSHRSYDDIGIPDPLAVRIDPDRPVQEAQRLGLPREGWLIAYCA
ncbi:MAG TPA: cation:proton antiporter [Candidatus Polarisedimenticolaceae bacterium]|nr:cation:proton antiporter [Candidatus Polarisedimenticolaceae bacterium]